MNYSVRHVKYTFFVFALLNLFTISGCAQSPRRPSVSVVPAPNYGLTSAKTQPAFLMDGMLSKAKNMWTEPAALGWMNSDLVTLTFDLGKKQTISSVSIHTARGEHAEVSYPLGIHVFASTDNKQFRYLGDAVSLDDDLIGPYATRNFSVSKGGTARYITIKVIPNGTYFFCDEVSFKGGTNIGAGTGPIVQAGQMDEFVNKLRNRDFRKRILLSELAEKKGKSGVASREFDNLKKEIIGSDLQSENDFADYNRKVSSLSGGEKGKALSVALIDPWSNQADGGKVTAISTGLQLSPLVSGVHYGAFRISNSTNAKMELTIALIKPLNNVRLELFESYFVNQNNFKKNLDPLLQYSFPSKVAIAAGEEKYFFVKASGIRSGTEQSSLQVNVSDGQQYSIPLQVYVPKAHIDLGSNKLNAVNWAYYNLPALKGLESAARKDLLDHHINTITVSPSVVPPIDDPDNDGHFKTYLKNCNGFDNIILYLDLSKQFQKNRNFFNEQWKAQFISWYDHVISLIRSQNLSGLKVYIFPFDEAKPQELPVLREFSRWLKQNRPEAGIYATSLSDNVTEEILPYVDIIQVIDKKGRFNSENMSPQTAGKIWMYDTKAPASGLPPHQYYRLLAWKAYARNQRGVGFWNYVYGDNNNLMGKLRSHSNKLDNSVIYTYDRKLITTRRWEAFRQGMEEYAILKAYEKQFGRQKALTFCQQVLDNENNIALADQIRKKLLQKLK